MRILLIDPPGKNKGLNTGLGYLSAILKDHHEVAVLDLNNIEIGSCGDPNPDMPIDEMDQRIVTALDEHAPQVVGVSVKTFTADISKHIFKFIKSRNRKIISIAGGPHITLDGFNYVQKNEIDFGMEGEAEFASLELFKALETEEHVSNIEGLFWWRGGQLTHHPKRRTISDLDVIPLPYYDKFSSVAANGGHLREYPLLTSRGCPYKCTYCSMPRIMGGKWRSRSPGRVIQELQQAKKRYGSTSFTVVDDNFTLNLTRVEEICHRLVSENIDLPWNSQNGIRADRIGEDLAKKMKRSGCRHVWIGIETADEKVFEKIQKGETLEDIKRGIRHLKKAGIGVGGFFIVGLPYSTRESDLKSVDFVKEMGIDGWWFNFVPYPHTQAWKWVQSNGAVLRHSDGALQFGSNNMDPVFETEEYPKDRRIKTYDEIHIRMKYFDRMADPSLTQWSKWRIVARKTASHGFRSVLSLLMFILMYNAKLLRKRIGH